MDLLLHPHTSGNHEAPKDGSRPSHVLLHPLHPLTRLQGQTTSVVNDALPTPCEHLVCGLSLGVCVSTASTAGNSAAFPTSCRASIPSASSCFPLMSFTSNPYFFPSFATTSEYVSVLR
eukprot:Sspe_Gene.22775::Locus_8713_Transcript_1_1_Confidence_1.000_Length_1561::g.22775::m.22775